jgi:hypothetical protein
MGKEEELMARRIVLERSCPAPGEERPPLPQMHILHGDGHAVPMNEERYEAEKLLQRLLAETPDIMPGELIDEYDPRRWLLVSREAGIALEGAGKLSLDHLFLDQDGIPTLVEVKRSSDTRLRREVVAQMLDYAANLSVLPSGRIRELLDRRCAAEGIDVDDATAGLLGDDHDTGSFWDQVESNLRAGRIRLVFLADRIGPGLKQIIEFLNGQFARAEVLGVEVRQWRGEGMTALVSTVVGKSSTAAATKGQAVGRLTSEEFSDALDGQPRGIQDGVQMLTRWCEDHGGWVSYGSGRVRAAAYLNWRTATDEPIWVLIVRLPSIVAVPVNRLRRKPPFTDPVLLRQLIEKLNAIDGISLSVDRARPNFPLEVLSDPARVQAITDVLAWFVQKLDVPSSPSSIA